MAIIVVCPGCRKSFKVSDQFAGRSGPCPKCKRTIQVPTKAEEVQVHAPEEFAGGGRSTSGKLVIKPVAFQSVRVQPVTIAVLAAASLAVLLVAWIGGRAHLFDNRIITALGLLIISPPLASAAYTIVRDQELEPYSGRQFYIRSLLCGLAYAILWGVFAVLESRGIPTGDMWSWLMIGPPFILVGGLFAIASFDLEFGDGIFHYSFYLLTTILLRWAAGMKWIWDM